MDPGYEDLVAQFSGITGASPATAQTALTASDWNLEQAVTLYFASQDAPAEDSDDLSDEDAAPSLPSTTPAANNNTPANRPPPNNQSNMVRTFRDLQNDEGDDDHADQDPQQDFFAGGEKSGLAVQDPNRRPQDHFRNILQQARENRDRPADDDEHEEPAQSSAFQGRAQTLGGDDAPSRVIEDPSVIPGVPTNARPSLPRVSRTLHLWQDGFSIDDGELHRFDDPRNAPVLALINQGRAPLNLLGVQPGQEVDLQLDPHKDENYVRPKQQYKPFGGSGQRLGSPAPGPSGPSSSTPAPAAAAASSTAASSAPKVDIDEAQPTVQLQIRLGDGTRLISRFNTSHTVGDVYNFVTASSTASQSRAFTLMTTFPNKDLEDKSAKLEDLPELKRGGVVVQKWN
ncbi:SEP-domain-containing protein [Aureobasidium sp. EXF-3400]|nr:SEP-domain-containing protein [Aureobasidium sp. EXF-12344]KAI4783391.1 SEP-domain-containing protein [Aureobasidium sp. EXF-3400]